MNEYKTNLYRIKPDVVPRTVAATDRPRRRFHKPKAIQQAEVLESNPVTAKIVFHDPIPRGEYNLVVSTSYGDGRDYTLRRIGHPVTVP